MTTQRNHPNATPAETDRAWNNVYRAAVRAGYDHNTAEDMAQTAMSRILFREHGDRCPATILRAASWEIAACKRWGWSKLIPRADRPRGTEEEQARELATMAIVRRRSAMLTPAAAAEYAETRRLSLAKVIAAQGVGITDPDDDRKTSAVAGERVRPPLPTTGAEGLHTATDPVPGSHARAAAAVARHHAEAVSR